MRRCQKFGSTASDSRYQDGKRGPVQMGERWGVGTLDDGFVVGNGGAVGKYECCNVCGEAEVGWRGFLHGEIGDQLLSAIYRFP